MNDISGDIEAVILKLGIINVQQKRNEMAQKIFQKEKHHSSVF